MCESCPDEDNAAEKYNTLTSAADLNPALNGWTYTDHDGDALTMTRMENWTNDDETLDVYYMTMTNQDGKDNAVRIPVEVILDMMDRLGVKVLP